MSASRSRLLSFVALLVGGGLAVVAAAQPWWRAVGDGVSTTFTGSQATAGLGQALAVVVLAGMLLMLVLKARGRRIVGVLLGLVGIGVAVVGLIRQQPTPDAVRTQVREISLVDQFELQPTTWPWVYAVAGVLVVAGAVLTVVTARRWPRRADRFERSETVTHAVAAEDEPIDVWKAMDAGLDPTTTAAPDRRAGSPNVRIGSTGDTMEASGAVTTSAETGSAGTDTSVAAPSFSPDDRAE